VNENVSQPGVDNDVFIRCVSLKKWNNVLLLEPDAECLVVLGFAIKLD
jgi:hypothetical protein